MPLYVMLSNLTDEGRKTVKANPGRIREVTQEVEKMGAKVIAQYAVLGQYDFVNILEAPDSETMARISVDLGSRGTLQPLTMAAMSLDDFIRGVGK
ncbi:MAG: GYD domain-containing protein [Chloroflexota bacterium]